MTELSAELAARNDAARVRLVLSRELETISHYESLASSAESPEVRAFLLHLAAEEKEHVAEAMSVLRQLDGGQDAHFQRDVSAHLTSVGAAGSSGPQPATVGERPGAPARSVGSPRPAKPANGNGDADLRVPSRTEHVVHALPYSPVPPSGGFTVGPLRVRR